MLCWCLPKLHVYQHVYLISRLSIWSQLCCGWIYGDELTGKNLEGSGEEEASTFLQSEELAEEEEERQAAEDDG